MLCATAGTPSRRNFLFTIYDSAHPSVQPVLVNIRHRTPRPPRRRPSLVAEQEQLGVPFVGGSQIRTGRGVVENRPLNNGERQRLLRVGFGGRRIECGINTQRLGAVGQGVLRQQCSGL